MSARKRIPTYRLHKSSGQAVVTIAGHDHYLGVHGSPESQQKYARLIAEYSASGQVLQSRPDLSVEELLAAYWVFAQAEYQKDGKPTGQIQRIKSAMIPLRRLYGGELARDFGPRALKAVRQQFVESGWCRRLCNQSTGCLVRIFKWGAAEELVPASVWHALQAVEGLKRGRTTAPDHKPKQPVSQAHVEATLKHLPAILADLVRVQLLTGARPGEAVRLRGDQLERSGSVWLWHLASHKTEHHEHLSGKVLFVGPRCQEILLPYLQRHGDGYLFSPRESMAQFRAGQRANRKSRVQPSQEDRSKDRPRKQPGEHYDRCYYARKIGEACRKAGLPHWHPHQLRHTAATLIAEQFGLETARIVLGHSSVATTRIYAAIDVQKAIAAMTALG